MSRDTDHDITPIEGTQELVSWIESGVKRPDERGIGTEHEKFGLWTDSLKPVTFEGDRGIGRLFERLAEHDHWEPEYDRGNILALVCHTGAALTLEPGGQLELSGAVTRTVHGTASEVEAHLTELDPVSEELGIVWLGAGAHPLAALADIPWMPKTRYALMRPFLGARGSMAHTMMKATATVQANFDYTSEADARDLLQLSSRLSPFVSAVFANSPILGGHDTGYASYRCHVWSDVDPARTGTPEFYVDGTMTFERYVDYVLDIPIMFFRRNGDYLDMGGRTFRDFMERGFQEHRPTMGDWELHLSTAFPDVRLKQFFEVRMADAGDRRSIMEIPAFWKGLLYDHEARDAAHELVDAMTLAEERRLAADVARRGLNADWRGQSALVVAQRLAELTTAGLDRLAGSEPTETIYLERVIDLLSRGQTPADLQRATWIESGGDPRALVELLRM